MDNLTLYYCKSSENALPPFKTTNESVGLDLYSTTDVILQQHSKNKISTDIKVIPPKGYYCQLFGRSSLSADGIFVVGGVIDPDYRGNIIVILYNSNDYCFNISKHQRIAQLVCLNYGSCNLKELDIEEYNKLNTKRNEKGFGSSNTDLKATSKLLF